MVPLLMYIHTLKVCKHKTYLEYQRFFGHKFVNFKAVVPVLLPTNDGISKEDGVLKREKKKMKNWVLVQHPIMVMFSLLLSAVCNILFVNHSFYLWAILFRSGSLNFIYSEKTTKFCEISTLDLSYVSSNGQIYGGDFAKFCGLLRIYEL